MKEKITVRQAGEPDQFIIESNHGELDGEWRDIYVRFSGYFGHHGPHKFAQGPVLYEALEDMLNGWKYIRSTHGDLYGVGWDRAQKKAEDALKLARGEV